MTDLSGDLFVVRTQAHREKWAAENIARQGDTYYLPQVQESFRSIKGGKRVREFRLRPLFPTYLFVKNPDGQWHHLMSTFGVLGIVSGTAGHPAILRANDLARIRALEDHGIVVLPKTKNGLAQGDTARITAGAYAGYCGLVQGLAANERVQVLLDYMGRKVPFLVREADLEEVVA